MAHLTIKQIMAGFKVSDMTVYTWRQGTPGKDPLPHTLEGRKVIFKDSEVKAWAKKHGLTFDAAAAGTVDVAKAGPKVKADPKAAAKAETAKRKTPAGIKQADAVSKVMESAKSSKTGRKIAAHAKKAERSARAAA